MNPVWIAVSLTLVIQLLGAGACYGVLKQFKSETERRLDKVETKADENSVAIAAVKAAVGVH